ncbi:MAG TPA: EAL domain-containing protein [Nocardioides sp.]|nr:EAL domain-containing protein [Nocardioides sp.]
MENVTQDPPDGAADHERRLGLILSAAPNALVMVDRAGHITLVNGKAEQAFGYSRDELLSMRIEQLLPERGRGGHENLRTAYFASPGRRLMGAGTEVYGRRKDGTELRVEVSLNPIVIGDERFVLASIVASEPRDDAQVVADGAHPSLFDSVPFSVISTDPAGIIVSANASASRLLGRTPDSLIGRPLSGIGAAGSGTELLADSLATRAGTERERDYRRSDGTTVPVAEGITQLVGPDGTVTGYLAAAYDITKHRQAQSAVLFMASHDALTNLPNRSMLVRHLVGAIDRAKSEDTLAALVLLDLDHFKRVNDSLGHHAGDVLLLQVADRLKRWAPQADMVARLGGDEFVVLFSGVEDAAALTAKIHEMLRALTAPLVIQGTELTITVSAGGVLCPHDADNPSALLRLADTAMYHAKAAGRNGFAWFSEPMLDAANERTSMASDLRVALRSGQLSVAYQPQLALDTGEVVGFEALARWDSPRRGAVRPDQFIPVAEESGMIVELGAWILDQACHDVAEMQRLLGRKLRIAVNCSPRQFHSAGWMDTVRGALERSGLAADQLELEITEGVLMDERWDVLDVLRDLRDSGVTIAIDDFGQGYSSLAYLTRFPIDRLKIDRAFVDKIQPGSPQAPIVDAIIGMAHALGMEVIAEGVEYPHQEAYLRAHGCEQVQGFLYSGALPVQEAVACAVSASS